MKLQTTDNLGYVRGSTKGINADYRALNYFSEGIGTTGRIRRDLLVGVSLDLSTPVSWSGTKYRSGNEPRSEKTGLRGFRPGPTQTGLYSHKRRLEA